ncbi:hypothetical protein PSACC_03212 [Paramicrosporidium saccamoebae]|uniref:G-patch domain-containing protein n=1 Tax=Paramicrosporidium saccamoebae TaxID=1246581 RepID=A0A2H9TGT1_9FUNG|nr:hypothetical protein PSACC_03212 [Paramicrosporidium saccamoebae]
MGKPRHNRPRQLLEECDFVNLSLETPSGGDDNSESTSLFFEDRQATEVQVEQTRHTKHTKNTKSTKSTKNTKHASHSSSDDDSGAEQDYISNVLANKSSDADDDEIFANLVKEYRFLMSPGSQKDIEWALDENAERILRERKASDPKYAAMKQEEFDDIVSFEGIYGKRQRKGRPKKSHAGPSIDHGGRSKKDRHEPDFDVNFKQLNREIRDFVKTEESGESFELEPHPPMVRKLVHQLAHMYGLRSKSSGQGVERYCVLIKCENTRLPRDLKRLDKFLEGAQKAARYAGSGREKGKEKVKAKPTTTAARVSPGTVIGSEAAPIEDDNIGNKMLRKLGWAPGQGLGSEKAGRTEPVEAVFRGNRVGLGH